MAFNFFQKFSQKRGLPKASIGKIDKNIRREKIGVHKDIVEKEMPKQIVIKQRPNEKNIFASKYIVSPHISEKASFLQETHNDTRGASYVFRATKGATKHLLKKAIEDRYDVRVNSVHIINTPDKEVRRGKTIGHKPGYKKAIITLRPGNTIEQV